MKFPYMLVRVLKRNTIKSDLQAVVYLVQQCLPTQGPRIQFAQSMGLDVSVGLHHMPESRKMGSNASEGMNCH